MTRAGEPRVTDPSFEGLIWLTGSSLPIPIKIERTRTNAAPRRNSSRLGLDQETGGDPSVLWLDPQATL